jgi:tetratricopeptide (TPR) repeat protein
VVGQANSARERTWIEVALVVAVAAAAYATSFTGDFQFDDIPAILQNPTLHHLWPLSGPLVPPPGALTVSGRPLLNLSFALNYAISGERIWSYHALNLIIHIAAALTLLGLVRRTLARLPGISPRSADWQALAVALIWVVHPATTESVTYVVQRAESLACLFYLLTLYCFLRGAEAGERPVLQKSGAHQSRGGFWFFLSVIACLLGMSTKEIVVSAPVAVLLYDRTFIAGGWAAAWRKRKVYYLSLAVTIIPLAAMVASSGWNRGDTSGFRLGVSPIHYWISQGEAVFRYVGLCFWPHPLIIDYGPSAAPLWLQWTLSALVLAGFAWTVVGIVKGRPWAFLPSVCFLILAPTSVIPEINQFIAEHRVYLPLAAIMTMTVVAAQAAAGRWISSVQARAVVLASLLVVILAVLGTLTARRSRDYRSDLVLWLDDIGKRPQSATAQANVGSALLTRGRIDEAIPYCVQSLVLDPMKPSSHYNLGLAYEEKDRTTDALREFALAAWINPKMVYAKFRAGRLLDRLKRPTEAETYLREVLAAEPEFAPARASLGVALAAEGRPNEAIAEFEHSLRLEPNQPEVEFNLGIALAGLGRIEEAASHYSAAIRLRPDYGDALLNRGVSLAQLGRVENALPDLEAAVRLLPGSAEAHANLGTVLDQLGRSAAAIAEYHAALRLKPDYPEAHYNLGNALLRTRNASAARAEFVEALRLKPDFGAAREMLDRLAHFSSGP